MTTEPLGCNLCTDKSELDLICKDCKHSKEAHGWDDTLCWQCKGEFPNEPLYAHTFGR